MISLEQAKTILNKIEISDGLRKYQLIMKLLRETDVSKNEEFQMTFRDFYSIRPFYSDEFARQYFEIFERLKNYKDISFQIVFNRIKSIQGTYEVSFSSKMVHSINVEYPIWDSVVSTKQFGFKAPSSATKNRENACCIRYKEYEEAFYNYMATDEGNSLTRMFDEKFPNNEIADVKKIDFILWQNRN